MQFIIENLNIQEILNIKNSFCCYVILHMTKIFTDE